MVLVVDDHAETCRAILMMLRLEGYEASAVCSGQEALDSLQSLVPDCIILDSHMPGMSGMDVLAMLRAHHRYDHVHIIMFSDEAGELERRAFAAGAQAFLQKGSLDWAGLQRTLRRFCEPCHLPESLDPIDEKKTG